MAAGTTQSSGPLAAAGAAASHLGSTATLAVAALPMQETAKFYDTAGCNAAPAEGACTSPVE